MEDKEDRLSGLPDSLLHHILSFLPSTKEAIRTGVLSKQWLRQWTRVPNLIFDFSDMSTKPGMFTQSSAENRVLVTSTISEILDYTLLLHDCSKIQKFHFTSDPFYKYELDPNHEAQLRFIIRKRVEELILKYSNDPGFELPNFFFRQAYLVKLQLGCCSFDLTGLASLESLKYLILEDCFFSNEEIGSILSGSPLLESLEVDYCLWLTRIDIASKSLKRLVLAGADCYGDISCPNIVEFEMMSLQNGNFPWSGMVLEKFISESPLLESLVLKWVQLGNLRIDSKILRKLVLVGVNSHEIEISCPHLEELVLSGSIKTIRLIDLPSSACAVLNMFNRERYKENVANQILEQLEHLHELKLGNSFIEALSALNVKSLTLENSTFGPVSAHNPGIVFAFRSTPLLERLDVKLQPNEEFDGVPTFKLENQILAELSDSDHSEENFWNLNGTHYSNLVSHLRTVKITYVLQREEELKLVLDFVELLLKNGKVLEKIVVILKDCGNDLAIEVSQKLSSFPRCPDTVVELLCS